MNFFCFVFFSFVFKTELSHSNTVEESKKYLFFVAEQKIYSVELTKTSLINSELNIFLHGSKGNKTTRTKTFSFESNKIGAKECEESLSQPFGALCCKFNHKNPVFLSKPEENDFKWTDGKGIFTVNFDKDKILFSGYFRTGDKQYQVSQTNDVYSLKEVKLGNCRCGTIDRHRPRAEGLKLPLSLGMDFFSYKKTPSPSIDETNNVLYIAVVADCSYVSMFLNKRAIITEIMHMFANVRQIYRKQLNIEVVVTRVILMEKCSDPELAKTHLMGWNMPCSDSVNISDRLSSFSKWRGTQKDKIAIYHLLTGCIEPVNVGLAWTGQVCDSSVQAAFDLFTLEKKYASGTSVTSWHVGQFYSIAHEIAHNLGARHDCSSQECDKNGFKDCCQCPGCDCGGDYLMHPISKPNTEFSPCSKKEIIEWLNTKPGCLMKRGDLKSIEGPVCGNGIKEEGEECDCGDEESCRDHPCCLPNCKLKPGAVCSDGNDLCCQDCQVVPKSLSKMCRKAASMCMKDSFCDGKTAECLPNQKAKDGSVCEYTEVDGSLCVNGICTSRKRQCILVGKHLGVEEDCNTLFPTCQVACNVPGKGCMIFTNQYYQDGMSCFPGGKCVSGKCQLTFGNVIKYNWPAFLILICLVVVIVLLCFYGQGERRRQVPTPQS